MSDEYTVLIQPSITTTGLGLGLTDTSYPKFLIICLCGGFFDYENYGAEELGNPRCSQCKTRVEAPPHPDREGGVYACMLAVRSSARVDWATAWLGIEGLEIKVTT